MVQISGATPVTNAIEVAREFALANGVVEHDLSRLCVIVEELMANLYEHGGVGPEDIVELSLARESDGVRIIVIDPGPPFDPRMAIQGMATRKGWDGKTWGANQQITVAEALRVNTLNGAYNSREEAIKGSITPGKLADFVVLSDDLFTVDVDKIKDLEIVRTVVGGNTVYQG